MPFFLLIYFLVYGLMNYYACRCLLKLFPLPVIFQILLILFSLLMIFAPLAIRLLDAHESVETERLWAYPAFFWMGFVLLLDSAFLVYGVICFLTHNRLPLSLRYIPLIYAVAALIYGFFEAGNIRLKMIPLTSKKIMEKNQGIKILQISDLHLGILTNPSTIRKVIALIRKVSPDLLISTGDFIDHCRGFDFSLLKEFSDLPVPLGKYAVPGNHEAYAGFNQAMALTQMAGFKLLLNEKVVLKNGLQLIGMKDGVSLREEAFENVLGDEFKKDSDPGMFSILLNHRPEVFLPVLKHFDLQLSGHTHKGQIFPFNLVTWLFFPLRAAELLDFEGAKVYVSPGTGTWGPPVRFLAFPEITCFILQQEQEVK